MSNLFTTIISSVGKFRAKESLTDTIDADNLLNLNENKSKEALSMTIQFINDEDGNPQFVVMGYEEYSRLTNYDAEKDQEENGYTEDDEELSYSSDEYYY